MAESLAESFLAAIRRGDRRRAFALVDEALDGGTTLASVYLEAIAPAMREIGRLWEENTLSVAEEHLATAVAQAAMSHGFDKVYVWRSVTAPLLVAACADEERHQVGLRMLCDLMELAGWETMFLGASVPVESLVDLVRKQAPDAIAISATIAPHVSRVRDAIAAIRAATLVRQPVIAVGGRAFAHDAGLAESVGADLTATDASEAVAALLKRVGERTT